VYFSLLLNIYNNNNNTGFSDGDDGVGKVGGEFEVQNKVTEDEETLR
jgi:hypothetical protein